VNYTKERPWIRSLSVINGDVIISQSHIIFEKFRVPPHQLKQALLSLNLVRNTQFYHSSRNDDCLRRICRKRGEYVNNYSMFRAGLIIWGIWKRQFRKSLKGIKEPVRSLRRWRLLMSNAKSQEVQ